MSSADLFVEECISWCFLLHGIVTTFFFLFPFSLRRRKKLNNLRAISKLEGQGSLEVRGIKLEIVRKLSPCQHLQKAGLFLTSLNSLRCVVF